MPVETFTCWVENQEPVRIYDYEAKSAALKFAELYFRKFSPIDRLGDNLSVNVSNSRGHLQTFAIRVNIRIDYVAEELDFP